MTNAIAATENVGSWLSFALDVAQGAADAANNRQAALGAAVTANNTHATADPAAREASKEAEASLAASIAQYNSLLGVVYSAGQTLQANQNLLNSVLSKAYVYNDPVPGRSPFIETWTYFLTSVDQSQFDALGAAQSAAMSALQTINNSSALLLDTLGSAAGYTTSLFATDGVNLAANADGQFLIAGPGSHVLTGGVGNDLFGFGAWTGNGTSTCKDLGRALTVTDFW